MTTPQDEFVPAPLRVYSATRDKNGERHHFHVWMPQDIAHEIEHWRMHESTRSFVTTHQLILNLIHYGFEELKLRGIDTSPAAEAFQSYLEVEHETVEIEASEKYLEASRTNYNSAKTVYKKDMVRARIAADAIKFDTFDPEVALKLRQIIA